MRLSSHAKEQELSVLKVVVQTQLLGHPTCMQEVFRDRGRKAQWDVTSMEIAILI